MVDELHLLQPQPSVHISASTPDRFLKAACRVIRKGYGYPSVFNADETVLEMLRVGKSVEDAREGGCSGCIETGAFGKEAYILTGYLNVPKVLELALHNGVDPLTGRQVGPGDGRPAGPSPPSTRFTPPSKSSSPGWSTSRCGSTTSSSACTPGIRRRRFSRW